MEIREFAERILLSTELEDKLRPPDGAFTDVRPGSPSRVLTPARSDRLRFPRHTRGAKMPHRSAFREPRLRAVAHHIMANHELQALEVMAWTLLAFPDAPTPFRSQVAAVMLDEQRHTRMHIRRMRELGIDFGDLPVNGHVWIRGRECECVLDYLVCLPLTFEGGNLDLSLEFAEAFDQAGDPKSREVMRVIHRDEIEHVALGVNWLRRLKASDQSDWEAYCAHLRIPMRPYHAKGTRFEREARQAAGMTDEFLDALEAARR